MTAALVVRVLAVVCWPSGEATADDQIGRVPFRHYGSDDGLSMMSLWVGVQDGAGFTWVGGRDGLVRYDGLRFRSYGLEEGLPSLLMTDLAVGPDGVLWGTTSRGAFHESQGKLVVFGVDVLPENAINQIAFDTSRRFWVTTGVGPFMMAQPGKLELAAGWPGGDAFAILFDPDGSLLISQGSRLLRRATDHADFRDVGQDFAEPITALVRDGTHRLWVRAGAHLWSQRTANSPFEDRSADYLGALPGSYSRHLALDIDKKLLIPSTLGLIVVDDEGGRFVPIALPADAMNLKACWVDREGTLWLAGLGLHRQTGRGLWRTASVSDGLPSDAVWGILRASTGQLVVATETGAAIDRGRGRLERLPGVDMAGYVTEGPPGTLWFAGNGRIVRFDLATNTARAIGAEAGLPPFIVTTMAADSRGYLWVVPDSAGVYRAPLSGLTGGPGRELAKFERVTLPGGTPNEMVFKIFIDGDRVWLATNHGLYVQVDGAWHEFTVAQGLRSNAVYLMARRHGELCVSYLARSDISCFVYAGGKLSRLHHREVPDKQVPVFMGDDAKGRLWLGTTRGVTVIDGDRVDQFPRADGAPGDDASFDSFLADPDGTVWIGTSSGLGRFDGARYRGPPPPPAVVLVSGALGDAPLDLSAERHDAVPYESDLIAGFSALSSINERNIEHQARLVGYDDDWHRADSREVQYQKLPGGSYRFSVRARRADGPWGEMTSFSFDVELAFWQSWWFRVLAGVVVVLAIASITRWRVRALERRNAELESIVQERTSELQSALSELTSEMDLTRRTHDHLVKTQRQLMDASRRAGKADVATAVLHNLGNALSSANLSAQSMREAHEESKVRSVSKVASLLSANQADLGAFFTSGAGVLLPGYMDSLVQELAAERQRMSEELSSLQNGIDNIKVIVAMQQSHVDTAGMVEEFGIDELVDDALELCTADHERLGVTVIRAREPLETVLGDRHKSLQIVMSTLASAAHAVKGNEPGNRRITVHTAMQGDDRVIIDVEDNGIGIPAENLLRIFNQGFTTGEAGHGVDLHSSACSALELGGTLTASSAGDGKGARFVFTLPVRRVVNSIRADPG